MKKVEGPTPCMVMVCVSGPAVRTSARTSDSFWSKNMLYDKDVILQMMSAHLFLLTPWRILCVCTRSKYLFYWVTHKSYPLHHSTSFLWVLRGLTKKASLPFKRHILTFQTASWQGSALVVQDSNQLWSITNLLPGVEGPDRFVKKRQKLMAARTAAHLPPQQRPPFTVVMVQAPERMNSSCSINNLVN